MAATELPLANTRIVELANVVAGPSVGKHLSDFGAQVTKVERPGDGDAARAMGELIGDRSAWWLSIGRNKRSVTLDLKMPRGREALLRLVESADALVESFRPGVLERLDLAPEQLLAANPRLIVVRVSAFGQTGPYSQRPGFGTLAEAFGGLAEISGYAGESPLLASFALADEVAGLFATWALLAALYHRDVGGSGEGQVIDVSLFESVFNILGPLPTLYKASGALQERNGSRLPWSSPRNVYRTRDNQFFAVSGTTPAAAEAIIRLVGGPELLADPRFATHESRGQNAEDVDTAVARWIAERDVVEVDRAFQEAGAAGVRVLSMADVFEDPQYQSRGTLLEVHDEELGTVHMAAPVPRMSATPARVTHVGPPLGHDTDDILRELGYRSEEIAAGRSEGAW
ncbi:MAG TPA: CoA transferase [Solirubrobacteraceae bacterium]|jgi:crotonobetainyl-CoA:carnitine CoA-transferase CaiB-like acyl-CoA transferase|nr:CoA transferase [Solirubrobacteraceae bacterium]